MSNVTKFLFEGLPIRGKLVQLDDSWQELLARNACRSKHSQYPSEVVQILGEMTAAGLLLRSDLKFDGKLTLQFFGTGNLKIVAVTVDNALGFRSAATFDGDCSEAASFTSLVNPDGQAKCALTITPNAEQGHVQPYQSLVPLTKFDGSSFSNVSTAISNFMKQSVQLETTIVLFANDRMAAGLLIQRLPLEGGMGFPSEPQDDVKTAEELQEHYDRIAILAQSIKPSELLILSPSEILHRLFWQEKLVLLTDDVLHDTLPHFSCSCSREKVKNMLIGLGHDEIKKCAEQSPTMVIDCNHCGTSYSFDPIDIEMLLHQPKQPTQNNGTH